jgi:MFS transporter, DHA3 family, macrolide efflux protein
VRTFLIIWLGQLVLAIGSQMNLFALTLWSWERTGSATALTLIHFFFLVASAIATPVAGILVDRWNRKQLMLVGDTVTALLVSTILVLYGIGDLQVWHLYIIAILIAPFSQIQTLAYQASLSLLVPERHRTRIGSLGLVIFYGSQILSPALAGAFYPIVGLPGIILIDLSTFVIAVSTLLFVAIPSPPTTSSAISPPSSTLHSLTFGFRYILAQPNLRFLLLISSLFWFAHEFGDALYSPMILARTGGNATVLGSISAIAGMGGVIGAIALSFWGGSKSQMRDMTLGIIAVGIGKVVFGLGRSPSVWLPTQFAASLSFPLFGSSEQAIWFARVESAVQGQVFAAVMLTQQVAIAAATGMAGPLADLVFEPAMLSKGWLTKLFGAVVGTEPGSGIALLYVIVSATLPLIGLGVWVSFKSDVASRTAH